MGEAKFQISQVGPGAGVVDRAFTGSSADVGGGLAGKVTLTPILVPLGGVVTFFIDDVPQLPTPGATPALIDAGGGVRTFDPVADKYGTHRIRMELLKANGEVVTVRRSFKFASPLKGLIPPALNQVGDSTATLADVGDAATIEATEDNEGESIREYHTFLTALAKAAEEGGAGPDRVGGFFDSPTGKNDGMVWTDIGIASQQSQASGILVLPPIGAFAMVPFRFEWFFAVLQQQDEAANLATGHMLFDDGVGTPDTRIITGQSVSISPSVGQMSLNDVTISALGDVSININNGTGVATNLVRGILTVGPIIALPFDPESPP